VKYYFLGDATVPSSILATFGGKALKLHQLFASGFNVPPGLVLSEESILNQEDVDKLGGFPLAVRSSGALEDLEGASFAGLYETFLDVRSVLELNQKIHDCFASRDSHRVKDYLKTKKIETPKLLKMSVLVQKMINPEVAGVLFTLNPLNGKEEEIYLEYCQGLGERLVSGHVTPTRVRFDWRTSTTLAEDVNDEGTRINPSQLDLLIGISLKIQAFYGQPQDIEWAFDKADQLHILQSRPVTSYLPREDRPELTNADFKDGGVSARVCSPCMYSIYRDAVRASMGQYFKKIRLIPNDEHMQWTYHDYGRVYWNAGAVKEGLKKIPAFKEDDFDRDLGIQKDYGANGPHVTPVNLATIIQAVPVLLSLYTEFGDCLQMIETFRASFPPRDLQLKGSLISLNSLSMPDFNAWLGEVLSFQQETERNYFRTIYNNANFQSEFKSLLKKLPAYETGDEIDLMGELHGVTHLDVQSGLARLRQISDLYGFSSDSYYRGREEFLSLHYHHGPAELDLTIPRWGEKKEWVDELVEAYVATASQPRMNYKNTVERLCRNLGFLKKRKFIKLLERSRNFLRLREEMRSFSTRAYYLLRLGLLEFARRNLLAPEKVFMLDIQEISQSITTKDYQLPDTGIRWLAYQGYRHFVAPNEFGGDIQIVKTSGGEGELKGLGCSPGEFIGRARVILDIHATASLTKSDILVTRFTDPGWTPVLARVGGVITEVGGLLSHAAVIGREYCIPAILNLSNATRLVHDGDLIKINGKTGVVEILEKSSDCQSNIGSD
jgi:phosphohistidine swiveling domain-containing protein